VAIFLPRPEREFRLQFALGEFRGYRKHSAPDGQHGVPQIKLEIDVSASIKATQLHFEDVSIGDEPPRLAKAPLTTMHLMRWSAAIENWHRIHFDEKFSIEHDKLPGLLVNGSFKQNFIVQALKDWAGLNGWVWKVSFQFRKMDIGGTSLWVWLRVTAKHELKEYGIVELELGIVNGDDRESTPGKAIVALPYRGKRLPYPFVPPVDFAGAF
jgi:acyl dehydratase